MEALSSEEKETEGTASVTTEERAAIAAVHLSAQIVNYSFCWQTLKRACIPAQHYPLIIKYSI